MRGHIHRFKRVHIQFGLFARINLAIVCVVSIVLVLTTTLLIAMSTRPMLEKDRLLSEEAANKLCSTVSDKYNLLYNQSNLLLSSGHVGFKLANEAVNPQSIYEYENTKVVLDYLTALMYSDTEILDVAVLSKNGRVNFARSSVSGRTMSLSYDYLSQPEFSELMESDRNIGMYYAPQLPYVRRADTPVVTFIAKIYNPLMLPRKHTVGILLVNYPLSVFEDAYQQLGALSSGKIYVLNGNSAVVFSNDDSALGTQFDESKQAPDADTAYHPIGISGIRIVSVISRDVLRAATDTLILTMLLILVPSIILVLLIVLLLNRHYQRKLNQLADAMEDIAVRGLIVRLPVTGNDEIGRLSMQFNKMLENLDAYIQLHYKAEVGRRTAELNALQAQINPHFLFNTIEGIRMRAAEAQDIDVADMLIKLGNLFRWTMMMDKQIVYLEDEIEYNESYLSLQKLRYEDSFESRICVSDETLYLGVPKFTLQPIVENALLHGLKGNGLAGHIDIRVAAAEGIMTITVADDGSGIKPEELERLRKHITAERSDPNFGIGLQNVHSRIRMLFGDSYGIAVVSELNVGTTVTVTLPAKPKKEMETYVSNDSGRR